MPSKRRQVENAISILDGLIDGQDDGLAKDLKEVRAAILDLAGDLPLRKGDIFSTRRVIDMRKTGGPRIRKGSRGTVLKTSTLDGLVWVDVLSSGIRQIYRKDLKQIW